MAGRRPEAISAGSHHCMSLVPGDRVSDDSITELLDEAVTTADPETAALCLKSVILEAGKSAGAPPPLSSARIKGLARLCSDWRYCEDDPDHHTACTAVWVVGDLGVDHPAAYAVLETPLLDAEAPRCVQNHAARALGRIGTPAALEILGRAGKVVAEWAAAPAHETYRGLLEIIRTEMDAATR